MIPSRCPICDEEAKLIARDIKRHGSPMSCSCGGQIFDNMIKV